MKSKNGQTGFFGKRLFFAFPLLISDVPYPSNREDNFTVRKSRGTVTCDDFYKAVIPKKKGVQRVLISCKKYK